MRVLVTGGAGFIGSRTALRLLELGHDCVVLDSLHPQIHSEEPDRSPTWRAVRSACKTVVADVRDENALEQALQGCDAVLHLAAETGTGQSMYEVGRYASVNATGTASLLDLVSRQRERVQRFVVASSRSVYGEGSYDCPDHGILTPDSRTLSDIRNHGFEPLCPHCRGALSLRPTGETAALRPASVYAITKLAQEQLTAVVCGAINVPWFALRYQNVYGPGQSLKNPYTGVLSIFSRLMRQQADLEIFEDGLESRDFVYIEDVVEANIAALSAPAGSSGIANVGSGAGTSINRLVELLGAQYGYQGKVTITGRYRLGDIRHNIAATDAAARFLGIRARVAIEEGVGKFCEWAGEELATEPQGQDAGYRRSLAELESRGLIS
jgi:dTDP-L-rhamnose 4-epimerase